MRLTGQKKYICFLFILMLLASVMVIDTRKVEACCMDVCLSQQTHAVYIDKDDIARQYAYIEEKSEKSELVNGTTWRVCGRRDLYNRTLGGIVCPGELTSEESFRLSGEAASGIHWEHSSSAAIISYVHHKDGSKE